MIMLVVSLLFKVCIFQTFLTYSPNVADRSICPPSAAHEKAMPTLAGEPNHGASDQRLLASQGPNTDGQRKGLCHGLQPKERSGNVEGTSSHRPKPRQPQRKGLTGGTEKGKRKEKRSAPSSGGAPGKPPLQEEPDRSSNRTQADGVQTNVGHFLGPSNC